MDSRQKSALFHALRKGQIKACIIKQGQKNIFEYYKTAKTENSTHPIHSCSKSVISMLIGICIREGLIDNIHTPVHRYFQQYFTGIHDGGKAAITLYHLLTMTPGFDWPEFGEWNFGTPMEYSKDMVGFVLGRALVHVPGSKMNYNSGCSNLLSAVIQTVSGMKTVDFAYKHLFTPLGIDNIIWHEKQGISLGANGLRMKLCHLLSLGSLYLHNGLHKGVQLVPRSWVAQSLLPRYLTYPHIGHYGYHWWAANLPGGNGGTIPYYFAMGLFGQFIIVVPEYDAVVVFISENYGDTMKPMGYFRELIAPAIGPGIQPASTAQ